MADYRNDVKFQAKVTSTRAMIDQLAGDRVDDALAVQARGHGAHNLTGHEASLVPLAVLFSQYNSTLLTNIKNNTDLYHDMGVRGSSEARDNSVWNPIKAAMTSFKATHGADIIAEDRFGNPLTVDDVSRTYLSDKYLGGQTTGGAGDTVLKRTLKLLGHVFY